MSDTQTIPPPPAPRHRAGFFDDFRRFFVRGVATLLPTLITILLLVKLWEILWDYLGKYMIWLISTVQSYLVPDWEVHALIYWWKHEADPWLVQLLGVLLAIVLVYIVGLFVGNFIGRTAWRLVEMGLMRIPLIRAIYPAVKQVTDYVLADRRTRLRSSRVVAVEPHANGIWSLGLVTGPGIGAVAEATETEMVTVFIPSSPTAFSGYVVLVPRERVLELPLTVEEAMRLLVTAGVSGPASQTNGSAAVRGEPSRLPVDVRPPQWGGGV